MAIIDYKNSASWMLAHHFKELLIPIMEKYQLGFVSYTKFDSKGITTLYTDKDYINYTINELGQMPAYWIKGDGQHLWSSYMSENNISRIEDTFGYYHGKAFVTTHPFFTEQFVIALDKNNTTVNLDDYYNNDSSDFNTIQAIRTIATNLIKTSRQDRIPYTKTHIKIEHSLQKYRPKKNITQPPSQLIMYGKNGLIELSENEIKCLFYLLQSYSLKEISAIIKVSVKTVDHYISLIKIKLGIKNKSAIFDLARKNLIFNFITD